MSKGGFWSGLKSRLAGSAPPEPEVAIFSEGPAYWPTFKPVAEALLKRGQRFSYLTLDRDDPGLRLESELAETRCLGSGALGLAKVGLCRARVLLSTTPNMGQKGFPVIRPPQVGCLAHIFHSVCDLSYYRKGSVDHYDAVLLPGDFARESVRFLEEKRGLKTKECPAVGLPYLDDLAARSPRRTGENPNRPPVLLLAPSWGEKGFLTSHGPEFMTALAEQGGQLIIRPHPQSLKSEKSLLDAVESGLKPYGNVRFDYAPDCARALSEADVLISDSSSIRYDFAFLHQRPVITLAVPEGRLDQYERADLPFRWEADLEGQLGPIVPPGERGDLAAEILRLLAGLKTGPPPELEALRDRYLANFGRSGEAAADWLMDRAASASPRP